MKIADKRRNPWRVSDDPDRRIVCLIGRGDRRKDEEHACDDRDARGKAFHKMLPISFKTKRRIIPKHGRLSSKKSQKRFRDSQAFN